VSARSMGLFLVLLFCTGRAFAGPCDEALSAEQGLPTILLEKALINPVSFTASDGHAYYLADLMVPEPFGEMGAELLGGGEVYVQALAEKSDRWGRKPAILLDNDRRDLSARLVEAGVAIVKPQLRDFNCLKLLIKLERDARKTTSGLWVVKNVIIDYKSIGYAQIGLYGIVEAELVSVGQTRSRTYLNFGERWTEDLTGIIQRRKLADFSEFGHDLSMIEGRRVRLRGVVQLDDGPQIELKHPAQLELLD